MQLRLPVVDERRCTACGDCVSVCPVECLEMGAYAPRLAWPRDCLACDLCVRVCSTEAIELREIVTL
ncbi:MAG: ferredoxin [Gemmataceae bacterium]